MLLTANWKPSVLKAGAAQASAAELIEKLGCWVGEVFYGVMMVFYSRTPCWLKASCSWAENSVQLLQFKKIFNTDPRIS